MTDYKYFTDLLSNVLTHSFDEKDLHSSAINYLNSKNEVLSEILTDAAECAQVIIDYQEQSADQWDNIVQQFNIYMPDPETVSDLSRVYPSWFTSALPSDNLFLTNGNSLILDASGHTFRLYQFITLVLNSFPITMMIGALDLSQNYTLNKDTFVAIREGNEYLSYLIDIAQNASLSSQEIISYIQLKYNSILENEKVQMIASFVQNLKNKGFSPENIVNTILNAVSSDVIVNSTDYSVHAELNNALYSGISPFVWFTGLATEVIGDAVNLWLRGIEWAFKLSVNIITTALGLALGVIKWIIQLFFTADIATVEGNCNCFDIPARQYVLLLSNDNYNFIINTMAKVAGVTLSDVTTESNSNLINEFFANNNNIIIQMQYGVFNIYRDEAENKLYITLYPTPTSYMRYGDDPETLKWYRREYYDLGYSNNSVIYANGKEWMDLVLNLNNEQYIKGMLTKCGNDNDYAYALRSSWVKCEAFACAIALYVKALTFTENNEAQDLLQNKFINNVGSPSLLDDVLPVEYSDGTRFSVLGSRTAIGASGVPLDPTNNWLFNDVYTGSEAINSLENETSPRALFLSGLLSLLMIGNSRVYRYIIQHSDSTIGMSKDNVSILLPWNNLGDVVRGSYHLNTDDENVNRWTKKATIILITAITAAVVGGGFIGFSKLKAQLSSRTSYLAFQYGDAITNNNPNASIIGTQYKRAYNNEKIFKTLFGWSDPSSIAINRSTNVISNLITG